MSPESTPRLLSLAEVATKLHMKRSNVAKFLARRGVEPAFTKAQGYLWYEHVIDKVKKEHAADTKRRAADAKRRESALRNVEGAATNGKRLGPKESEVLVGLLTRPQLTDDAARHAARRLRLRGLIERVEGEPYTFRLTAAGRETAGQL